MGSVIRLGSLRHSLADWLLWIFRVPAVAMRTRPSRVGSADQALSPARKLERKAIQFKSVQVNGILQNRLQLGGCRAGQRNAVAMAKIDDRVVMRIGGNE